MKVTLETLSQKSVTSVTRVLYIDGDSDELRLGKSLIEELDAVIQIETSSSPENALDKIGNGGYSCIVSCYRLPSMDGIQLARRIKEKWVIPFILLTGYGSEEVAEAAFLAGVDGYVRKSVDLGHYRILAQLIRKFTDK